MRRLAVLLFLPALAAPARAAEPPDLEELLPIFSRIRGLSLSPKLFESDGNTSLGLGYDYGQDFDVMDSPWLRVHLTAFGNVAFRPEINPRDFLSSRAGLRLFESWGGTAAEDRSQEALAAFADLRREAAGIESAEELEAFLRSEAVREYTGFLRPQFAAALDLDGGLESDQRFTNKQWVLGAALLTELELWGRAANANIFDYPFALLRFLTGQGPFRVLGSAFPTAAVGLDLVYPDEEDPRSALGGEEESFARARLEVGFRTELVSHPDQTVFVNATWRAYQELGASEPVKERNLDTTSLIVLTISSSKGVFVSYSDGRLPLDAENDRSYALGWEFHW